jgi:hypothetical protein
MKEVTKKEKIFWEDYNQEIRWISWNEKVHCRADKKPPLNFV